MTELYTESKEWTPKSKKVLVELKLGFQKV